MLRYFFSSPAKSSPLQPPPLPPSLRPPSPTSNVNHSNNLKKSFEIHETLTRLEQKIDILLAKFNALEQRKKFATVTVAAETSVISESPIEKHTKISSITAPTFGDSQFKDELARRVEELRAIKHMGESHGFEPQLTKRAEPSNPDGSWSSPTNVSRTNNDEVIQPSE